MHIQASYKGDYERSKDKNLYKVTDTDQYKSIAEGQKALSDVSKPSVGLIVNVINSYYFEITLF